LNQITSESETKGEHLGEGKWEVKLLSQWGEYRVRVVAMRTKSEVVDRNENKDKQCFIKDKNRWIKSWMGPVDENPTCNR
jgi:hypothetical protein